MASRNNYSKQSFEMQIANPLMARGLRYKDEGGCFPSATTTLHAVGPLQQTLGNAGTYSGVSSGTYIQYLFRDVLRSTVQFVANPTVGGVTPTYSYTAQFVTNSALALYTLYPADASEEVELDVLSLYDTNAASTSSTFFHPHGPVLYPGQALGRKAIYMDIGAVITWTQSVGSSSMELLTYLWDGMNFNLVGTKISFAASTAVFTVTAGTYSQGYYAFAVQDTSATANHLSAILTGNGDVFGHRSIPQVEGQLINLQQSRVLANSLLISNTASAMNVEGSVWAAQFPGSELWYNRQTSASIGLARDLYDGRAATGVYGWLKPYKTSDFDYRAVISQNGSIVTNSSFPLDNSSPFIVMTVNTVSTGTTWPGLDLLLTQAMAIEFVTQSQWYENELPMMTTLARIQAIDKLEAVPQFSENPTHLENIWESIKYGGRFIKENRSAIGGAVAALYPGLGQTYDLVDRFITGARTAPAHVRSARTPRVKATYSDRKSVV